MKDNYKSEYDSEETKEIKKSLENDKIEFNRVQ